MRTLGDLDWAIIVKEDDVELTQPNFDQFGGEDMPIPYLLLVAVFCLMGDPEWVEMTLDRWDERVDRLERETTWN